MIILLHILGLFILGSCFYIGGYYGQSSVKAFIVANVVGTADIWVFDAVIYVAIVKVNFFACNFVTIFCLLSEFYQINPQVIVLATIIFQLFAGVDGNFFTASVTSRVIILPSLSVCYSYARIFSPLYP